MVTRTAFASMLIMVSSVGYAVTSANIHDSQMLPRLLDPENERDYVWGDSAYSGECFEDLLSLGGYESLIHEKGARNHPLGEAAKELNRIKSAIRVCVEHVFGGMTYDHVDGWKDD